MAFDQIIHLPYLGMPFHFWTLVFLVFGCTVGSFLNVVIYRLPIGQSIAWPPSHCPHCKYSIPWYLNIPLLTWLYLHGKCANCRAPVSMRYFVVELMTGIAFMTCWLAYGHTSPGVVFCLCIFLSGIIAGTFIDFEHFISPDEITYGGIVVGLACSFIFPDLQQGASTHLQGLFGSIKGALFGAGLIYGVLRLGKLLLGKQRKELPQGCRVTFGDSGVQIGDETIAYEEFFYRKTDEIEMDARRVEMADRCYAAEKVRLRSERLTVGKDEFDPQKVPFLEAEASEITLPREAMGLGDVKFMAAVGAFLGWQSVIFTLMVSCVVGSAVGLTLIALKKSNQAGRLAFVPYLALGTVVWIFGGVRLWYELYGPIFSPR